MKHYYVRNQRGFTLVEVIVVTIILGIVGTIAVPSLFSLLNRNRVDRALAEVEGALREAQKRAIRNGRSCQITITRSANDDTSDNNNAITGNCLLSNRNLLPNSVMKINSNRANITFSGKGNITVIDAAGSAQPRPTVVVYVPNGLDSQRRCVVIENSLGSIRTGNYSATPPADTALAWNADDNCQ